MGTAGDTAQRHRYHQHEALCNGGAGYQHVPLFRSAVALKNSVHGNDHDIVNGNDDKWCKANCQYMAHNGKAVSAKADAQPGALSKEEEETIGGTGHLGKDGGQGSAGNAHIQKEDEYRVQSDVQCSAQQYQPHTDLGKALGQDKLAQARGEQGKDGAADIDSEVGIGIGVGGVAGTEEIKHGAAQGDHHRSKHHGGSQKHHKAVGQDAAGTFLITFTKTNAHQRSSAYAD